MNRRILCTLSAILCAAPSFADDESAPRFRIMSQGESGFAALETATGRLYILRSDKVYAVFDSEDGTFEIKPLKVIDEQKPAPKTQGRRKPRYEPVISTKKRTIWLFDTVNGHLLIFETRDQNDSKVTEFDFPEGTIRERTARPNPNPEGAEKPQLDRNIAIGALRTLTTGQAIFREGDKDSDGVFNYGTLAALGKANLIDATLASGKKAGYVFQVQPAAKSPEYLWFATAFPENPKAGDLYYFTDQSGVIKYSEEPFKVDSEGKPDRDLKPIGN